MVDMLEKLYAAKAIVRRADEEREPLAAVRARARERMPERRRLRDALADAVGCALIAEIKHASPSLGRIVPVLDAGEIARQYDLAGADAISVLTESSQFLGQLAYLDVARTHAQRPILRKDFLTTRYEVAQAAAYGADAVLAIVAGLSDEQLAAMMDEARTYDLDVLVEIHDEPELARALAAGATLLGMNNRDLRTFATDLRVTEALLPLVPAGVIAISESGVRTSADTQRLAERGARGFLVGESLMQAGDKAGMIRALKGVSLPAV
jgi:indole-3-glycerol phosphate synthase